MVRCSAYGCSSVIIILYVVFAAVNCVIVKEQCDGSCIAAEKCHFFGTLKKDEQTKWRNRFECDDTSRKGDICCPENVWQTDTSVPKPQASEDSYKDDKITLEKKSNFPYQPDYNNYNGYPNNGGNQYGQNGNQYGNPVENQYGNQYRNPNGNQFGNQNGNQGPNRFPNQNGNQFGNQSPNQFPNQNGNQFGNQSPNQFSNQNGNQYGGPDNRNAFDNGGSIDDDTLAYENTRIWANQNRQRPRNPYFIPGNQNNGNPGNFNTRSVTEQCPVTSLPPDPDSGCCGREATEDERIAASPNTQNNWMPQRNRPNLPPWMQFSDDDSSESSRKRRDTDTVGVTVDNRIAGGRETELEQFPWTVLLKTTFSYPDREAAFSCGGSLISSRYVLTAGHCVYDQKGSIKGVEIYLAEYDKRTFPKDCKNVLGKGQQCIENIVMEAENVNIHPQYDDDRLNNDIAVIRLKGVAPYTDYIRPVCLPPINVDSPDLSHLRLAVAGWGRNGRFKSNIKQSTVVNLITNQECEESYPGISKRQLCAAGYSGEDTCKGDSGGPLMMVYGGKYYISGVVSGKRADAPCGTSVPSLYTNVYQYLRWIRSVIRN